MSPKILEARAALKALGYNTRQVSIRQAHSTLRFTIRDAAINLAAVYAIARDAEQISRCSVSGEILCGGNTFTDVCLADDVAATLRAPLQAALAAAGESEHYDLSAVPGLAGVSVYRCDPWTWSSNRTYTRTSTPLEAAFAAWWHLNVVAPPIPDPA
jgi:hypothetical protein